MIGKSSRERPPTTLCVEYQNAISGAKGDPARTRLNCSHEENEWRCQAPDYDTAQEHHLNTIKLCGKVRDKNWINSIATQRPTKTLSSLFAIGRHFGKLAFYQLNYSRSAIRFKYCKIN